MGMKSVTERGHWTLGIKDVSDGFHDLGTHYMPSVLIEVSVEFVRSEAFIGIDVEHGSMISLSDILPTIRLTWA